VPSASAPGSLIARTLRGAWRAAPPPPEITADDLVAVAPALLRTGSAPLAVWRHRALVDATPALAPLHDAWRLQALHSVMREERLAALASRLREAGVEALLAKGWAMARLYPQPGLRPYGDHDLYVRPTDFTAALTAARSPTGAAVDLHRGLVDLDDRNHDEVLGRAIPHTVCGAPIRVLAPEDHLRLLCRHFLRHGASRPVWLCDVALVVEGRGPRFDWDLVLAGSARRRQAVLCVLGLAGTLLGTSLAGTPADGLALPRWLAPAVLAQWGEGVGHREPLASLLLQPAALRSELRRHWPNAVEALAALDGPFDRGPRLPFQLAHVAVRAFHFGLSLARDVARPRAQRSPSAGSPKR
jgi:hypothetical protein